MLISSVTTFSI